MDGFKTFLASAFGMLLVMHNLHLAHANPEVDALIAFKNALHDPQHALDTWDPFSVDPCVFLHVDCDDNSHVFRVDVPRFGLSGPLSPRLADLSHLQYLVLFLNDLTGPIPKELGSLTNLVSLDLDGNALTGTIPVELQNLPNILVLNLSDNRLTGPIPTGGNFPDFPAKWFSGNSGLCGEKIQKPCPA